jgi:phosphatidate phosphatase PAH1
MTFLLCLTFLCLNGQDSCIEKFCQEFQEKETTTHIHLKGKALQLAANYSDNKKEKKVLEKVLELRVLVVENQYLTTKKNYRGLIKQLKKDDFSTLMKVKDGNTQIDFLIKEYENTITDLVTIVRSNNNFVLLSLEGLLKFSDLNDLKFQLDGGGHFDKIPEKRSDIPQA